MTSVNDAAKQRLQPLSVSRRMILGAAAGLVLITVFLIGVRNPDPAWGKFWMIRPLIVVPLAGAGGSLFNYLVNRNQFRNEWIRLLIRIVGVIGFLVALWLGSVLGLDGTLWN